MEKERNKEKLFRHHTRRRREASDSSTMFSSMFGGSDKSHNPAYILVEKVRASWANLMGVPFRKKDKIYNLDLVLAPLCCVRDRGCSVGRHDDEAGSFSRGIRNGGISSRRAHASSRACPRNIGGARVALASRAPFLLTSILFCRDDTSFPFLIFPNRVNVRCVARAFTGLRANTN